MAPAVVMVAVLCASTTTATAADARPASDPAEHDRLVDMVVADVDGAVITYSELLAEANLLLLDTRGPRIAQNARLTRRLLRAVLLSMVHRELLLGEIRRLQLRPVSGSDIDRRLLELRRRFDDEAGWQRFLVAAGFRDPIDTDLRAPEDLRARLRAEAQVDQFLDVRIRLNIVVTDQDVSRCYQLRRSNFGDAELYLVAPRIEAQIRQQRESSALEALLEQLETRATVRYDPEFEPDRTRPKTPARAPGSGFQCP